MAEQMRLLIGTEHGLVALPSSDRGRTWGAPETVFGDVEAHALGRGPDGSLFLGTRGQGLFRSPDRGRSWTPVEGPSAVQKVRSFCVDGDSLLVGNEARPEPVGVFRWHPRSGWEPVGQLTACPGSGDWHYPVPSEGVHVRHVSVDPHQAGRIYAAVQVGGVGISPDNGRTWYDKRNLDIDVHMVEPHPGRPGVVYAGAGGSGSGFYRSEDYGENWQGLAEECGHFVVQFAIDPSEPSRILLGTARGRVPEWAKPPGAQGEMFRSEDGGDTWAKLTGGLPEYMEGRVNVVYVDQEEPQHVYFGAGLPSQANTPGVAHDAGVYFSPNRGESWQQIFALDRGEPLALWCVRE